MSTELVGYSGDCEQIAGTLDEAIGELDIAGATHAGHRNARRKLSAAHAQVSALAKALRKARQPSIEQVEPTLGELPFPLGTATITKSTSSNVNNVAQAGFRVLRLIIDEASATPAPWLLQVDDVLLGNRSQNVSSGAALATFYGPGAFYTPFRGSTIDGGLQARINMTNIDGTNSRVAYAALFGNALRSPGV